MNQLKDSVEYVLSNYDGYASVFGGKFQQRVLKDMPIKIRLEFTPRGSNIKAPGVRVFLYLLVGLF